MPLPLEVRLLRSWILGNLVCGASSIILLVELLRVLSSFRALTTMIQTILAQPCGLISNQSRLAPLGVGLKTTKTLDTHTDASLTITRLELRRLRFGVRRRGLSFWKPWRRVKKNSQDRARR